MDYTYELGVLAVTADPRYYPHVERHVYAMRKLCRTVRVLAVFPPDEAMPEWERTVLESVAPEPEGPEPEGPEPDLAPNDSRAHDDS